jgi:hypothetical protein
MTRSAFLIAVAALITAPALAAAPTVQPHSPDKADKPEKQIVCRWIGTTGSRLLGERICKTREQWERESDAQREEVERQEQRATGDPWNGSH